jgi:aspartokinase
MATSELIWLYVKRRPHIKEALRSGVVNYSALARRIAGEIFGKKRNANAIKAALIRIAEKLADEEETLEGAVLKVLKGSSITITTKVSVVITHVELNESKPLSFVKSRDFITYILPENEAVKVRKNRAIMKSEETLNLITVHSSPEIENTPGVISTILNALSSEGINVAEFISCYTDTLLVVKESDTTKAYEVLVGMMR